MPLNDHEQRILDEIERRLAEDDPNFVEQVGRTDLYSHLSRRIRLAALGFLSAFVGFLICFFVGTTMWLVAALFLMMLGCAALTYRYLGMLGRDQLREMQAEGAWSLAGLLGRIAERFRSG
jgi:hypothetical protein